MYQNTNQVFGVEALFLHAVSLACKSTCLYCHRREHTSVDELLQLLEKKTPNHFNYCNPEKYTEI